MRITRGDYDITLAVLNELRARQSRTRDTFLREYNKERLTKVIDLVEEHQKKDQKYWRGR